MNYVLYHANCVDGLGAKLAASLYFRDKGGAQYFAVNYGRPVPEIPDGSDVYILDFSYPRAVLEELHSRMKSVLVLDHHASAQAELAGLDYAKFSMKKSGAGLAWHHFHPDDPEPELVSYIEDRDLWKFTLSCCKEVHSGILACMALAKEQDDVSEIEPYLRDVTPLKALGDGIEKYKKTIENRVFKGGQVRGVVVKAGGQEFKCCLLSTLSELASDFCAKALTEYKGAVDFAINYIVGTGGQVYLSIRSQGENDSSKLAKALAAEFGDPKKAPGGGHKNAAGAMVKLEWLSGVLLDDSQDIDLLV